MPERNHQGEVELRLQDDPKDPIEGGESSSAPPPVQTEPPPKGDDD